MSRARRTEARHAQAVTERLAQVVGAERAEALVRLARDGPEGVPRMPETPTGKAMRLLRTPRGRERLGAARTWDDVLDL